MDRVIAFELDELAGAGFKDLVSAMAKDLHVAIVMHQDSVGCVEDQELPCTLTVITREERLVHVHLLVLVDRLATDRAQPCYPEWLWVVATGFQ